MNDPNGLIQWHGRYHLFYQYNPSGVFHGTIHWGHAVSKDLVRWQDLPLALAPTVGGPDKDGVFSGCAVDRDGVPALVYTGVHPEVQCLAEAVDPTGPNLTAWRKHPGNPVIAQPPAGLDVQGFRDPFVWREVDGWYCAVGSGTRDEGGLVLLYRSPDLIHWEYLHQLWQSETGETGSIWECPNFFPIANKHVLLISSLPLLKVFCFVGEYRGHRFIPERSGVLDEGGCLYAPQLMLDERGRRLMWGWLRENRDAQAQMAAGWSGVMSLPTEVSLLEEGTLCMRPVAELTALRGRHKQFGHAALQSREDKRFDSIAGNRLEIQAVLGLGGARQVGLHLLESPESLERTSIVYDGQRQELTVDRERASLDPNTVRDIRRIPLRLAAGALLTLRVFIDGSVLEVFANDRVCLRSRVYPTRADSRGVRPFADGGTAKLESLDIWEMRSIWRRRTRPTCQ
jgi:beta-fructofuranosidase